MKLSIQFIEQSLRRRPLVRFRTKHYFCVHLRFLPLITCVARTQGGGIAFLFMGSRLIPPNVLPFVEDIPLAKKAQINGVMILNASFKHFYLRLPLITFYGSSRPASPFPSGRPLPFPVVSSTSNIPYHAPKTNPAIIHDQ